VFNIHSGGAFARTCARGAFATAAGMALLALSGCSGTLDDAVDKVIPKREATYKSSKSLPPLEIPPDLSGSSINESLPVPSSGGTGTATYSEYTSGAQRVAAAGTAGVLPDLAEARVMKDGDKRWLEVDEPPSQVWPKVRDFWLNQGFIINVEDPEIGIMETDWAEQREGISGGLLQSLSQALSSAIFGTATRDKFRTRLERPQSGAGTEIYVSHRGAEEIVIEAAATLPDQDRVKGWQPRPSDPELEAEMLARMMVFFGTGEEQARQRIAESRRGEPERASIERDDTGASVLALEEGFSRAWRRTGLALDRVGFTVEDRDRSRGLYFVRYVDPDKDLGEEEKGFFSKLAFWQDDERDTSEDAYLVSLVGGRDAATSTRVMVLDKEGNRDATQTADRILGLLYQQLR
jgi:outer membrane protein assembly factor BamC